MSSNKIWKIYKHTAPNGKAYVGKTTQTLEQRAMGKYKQNKEFHNAIMEFGWDNFKHEVLLTVGTKEMASIAEEAMIVGYNTIKPNGYNDALGSKHSNETRKKMCESLKGRKAWNEGRHWSEEIKQKMSKTRRDLYDRGYINPRKGTPCSEEQKQLFKERMKEYCNEHGGPMTGKHHSEETKKKISNSRKGSPSTTKGKHRYTNGKIRVYRFECPEGFWQDKTNCK